MKRRDALTAVSAGIAAASGCLGGGTACNPGADEIASLPSDFGTPQDGGWRIGETSYAVRGTVVKHLGLGVLVSDGSGQKLELIARYADEQINQDVIEIGDCVEAEAPLALNSSARNRMPVMAVTADSFSKIGETDGDVQEVPDAPYVNGEPVSYNSYDESNPVAEGTVGVRYEGSDERAPTARNLFVLHGERADPWHELADEVSADQSVPDGSLATFPRPADNEAGLLWKAPDRTWARQFGGVGFAERR
ncbi:hypothetical protein [Haloarcula halophila]|uniref:hypothetical protein n=1 Tax=Haloarcula TaxID=2237 RepID=UPI0023E41B04|nr:hypothetical protein [Halomicroarcula sp. DFY41]